MDETQLAHAAACRDNEKGAAGRTARVLTWNINGLRKVAVDHGGLKQLLDQFNADISECYYIPEYQVPVYEYEYAVNTTSSQAKLLLKHVLTSPRISLIICSIAGSAHDLALWKMSCSCAL